MDGRRRALIVSADTYGDAKFRQLRMPGVDAAALRRVLEDPEVAAFEVEVSLNEPHHVVRGRIEEFFKAARVDDFLLLHFGCHGVKDEDGKLYLVATDTTLARLDSSGIDSEFVNRHMGRSRSRRIVLLLDCCYSGAFARGMATRAAGDVDIVDKFQHGRGRLVLTASTAMEYAWDGDDLSNLGDAGPSSFTAALVRGLETGEADLDHDGQISFRDLSDYVYEEVRAQNPRQTPQKWCLESEGDLYIARTPPPGKRGRRGAPRRRDYAALEPRRELVLEDEAFSVAVGPGSRMVAAGSDAVIALWRRDTEIATWRDAPGAELITDVHQAFVYSVAFSADGRRLATCGEDGIVHVRDLEGGRPLWSERHHTEAAYAVAFSPDGTAVASGGYDREVRILDAATGTVRRDLGCSHRVSSVAFSPDGRVLAIGSLDNTITVWHLGTGDRRVLAPTHQSSVERLAFSDDGRRLASCGLDKAVRVWDASSWEPLWMNATEHGYLVRGVAFAPDGATLASASWDKTVKLWNVETGQPSGLPWQAGRPRHTDWIWSVAFSPDGRVLASAGSDAKVILWMLPDAD